jgi:hypothetical protein
LVLQIGVSFNSASVCSISKAFQRA